jgi:hypothetical protein
VRTRGGRGGRIQPSAADQVLAGIPSSAVSRGSEALSSAYPKSIAAYSLWGPAPAFLRLLVRPFVGSSRDRPASPAAAVPVSGALDSHGKRRLAACVAALASRSAELRSPDT